MPELPTSSRLEPYRRSIGDQRRVRERFPALLRARLKGGRPSLLRELHRLTKLKPTSPSTSSMCRKCRQEPEGPAQPGLFSAVRTRRNTVTAFSAFSGTPRSTNLPQAGPADSRSCWDGRQGLVPLRRCFICLMLATTQDLRSFAICVAHSPHAPMEYLYSCVKAPMNSFR